MCLILRYTFTASRLNAFEKLVFLPVSRHRCVERPWAKVCPKIKPTMRFENESGTVWPKANFTFN